MVAMTGRKDLGEIESNEPPGQSGGGPPHFRTLRAGASRGQRASVVDCGGNPEIGRDTPLSPVRRLGEFGCAECARKRCRRCALPPQSKTRHNHRWLSIGSRSGKLWTLLRPGTGALRNGSRNAQVPYKHFLPAQIACSRRRNPLETAETGEYYGELHHHW